MFGLIIQWPLYLEMLDEEPQNNIHWSKSPRDLRCPIGALRTLKASEIHRYNPHLGLSCFFSMKRTPKIDMSSVQRDRFKRLKERIIFQVSLFRNYISFTGGVCFFFSQFYDLLDGCFRNPAISVHWASSERVMKIVSCNSLWILFFWMKHPRPSWVSFTVPFDGCHGICQYIGHRQNVPKNHPANKNAANLTRISNLGAFQLIFVGSFPPPPKKKSVNERVSYQATSYGVPEKTAVDPKKSEVCNQVEAHPLLQQPGLGAVIPFPEKKITCRKLRWHLLNSRFFTLQENGMTSWRN